MPSLAEGSHVQSTPLGSRLRGNDGAWGERFTGTTLPGGSASRNDVAGRERSSSYVAPTRTGSNPWRSDNEDLGRGVRGDDGFKRIGSLFEPSFPRKR